MTQRRRLWRFLDAVVFWIFMGVAIAIWGYALHSVFLGQVRIASRSTDVTIEFVRAPLLFVLVVCFYVAAGAFFIWVADLAPEFRTP